MRNRETVFSDLIQKKAEERYQLPPAGGNNSEARNYIYDKLHIEPVDRPEKTIPKACISMATYFGI